MTSYTNIFLTGATGYVGGSVLLRLLDHPNAKTFKITILTRSEDKAAKFETLGVTAVVGSFSELEKLEKLASEADVVFQIADSDNLAASKAILAGLKKRYLKTGTAPSLIHTSGTGVFSDMRKYETHYDDSNVEQMDVPITRMHRVIDLENVNADKEGYVKTYIILPSTIYGRPTGRIVDLGLQNIHSIQMPYLIKASIHRGQIGMVGDGKTIWGSVDIEDIADLYIVLYDKIVSDPTTGHGANGYYIGENGDYYMYDVCKAAGEALAKIGLSKTAEPTSFTDEECLNYFGGYYWGSTCLTKGSHSRAIGWKPKKIVKDFIEDMEGEVKALLNAKPSPQPDMEMIKLFFKDFQVPPY